MSIQGVASAIMRRSRGRPLADALTDQVTLGDLLRQAAKGDESAFAALYDATVMSSFVLACAINGDTREAEQAVLAAYIEVWRTAPSYSGDPSAQAWVGLIVQGHAQRRISGPRGSGPQPR